MGRPAKVKPAPKEGPPPAGHNQPPEQIGPLHVGPPLLDMTDEQWAERLDFVFAPSIARVKKLCEADQRFKAFFPLSAGDPPIGINEWSEDVMARAADLREKFREVSKEIEALHTLEKQPVLRAARAIDGAKNRLLDQMGIYDKRGKLVPGGDAPLNRISDRCTIYASWLNTVRQREAQAEADAKRVQAEADMAKATETGDAESFDDAVSGFAEAEAAQRAADAPAADRTRVHGVASVMSLRTRWEFDEPASDLMKLVRAVALGEVDVKYLAFNAVAIGAAVRSEGLRELPGCVIVERQSV